MMKRRSAIFRISRFSPALLVLAGLVAVPSSAGAWQILTALTDPCHEQLSFSAVDGIDGLAFPGDTTRIPSSALFPPRNTNVDPAVTGIAGMIGDEIGVSFDSDTTALVALSLFVGSRCPDVTEGSAYDFFIMRPLMLSDTHEDSHFLRRSYDDGPAGDATAIADGRALIREEIDLAIQSARGPLADRFVGHIVAIDFYGEVELPLYEPIYRLGRALHTFEDSFSHSLRSEDLHSILSVMNSIDALSDHFDESRDGMAHSLAMDRCMGDASEIAPVVAEAVRELVAAVSAGVDPDVPDGIEPVLDKWLGLTPGCTFENNYCDAFWLDVVRRDPYEPFIPMFLGCGAARAGSPWPLLLLLIPVVAFRARRNR